MALWIVTVVASVTAGALGMRMWINHGARKMLRRIAEESGTTLVRTAEHARPLDQIAIRPQLGARCGACGQTVAYQADGSLAPHLTGSPFLTRDRIWCPGKPSSKRWTFSGIRVN